MFQSNVFCYLCPLTAKKICHRFELEIREVNAVQRE